MGFSPTTILQTCAPRETPHDAGRQRSGCGTHQGFVRTIVRIIVTPGSVTSALQPLRMARKLDPYRETARMALEPWIVEAALDRLRQLLSPANQRIILKATRTPHNVKWPEWWSEHP
jgi:hypothetical protein